MLGFPGPIAATALNVFRGPRYITLGNQTAAAAYGRKGIPAGDTFATRFVKAHVYASFVKFAATLLPWRVVLVVDGFGIAATGTRAALLQNIPQA